MRDDFYDPLDRFDPEDLRLSEQFYEELFFMLAVNALAYEHNICKKLIVDMVDPYEFDQWKQIYIALQETGWIKNVRSPFSDEQDDKK